MKGNLQFRVVLPGQIERMFKAPVVLLLLALSATFAWAAVLQGQVPVPPLVGLVGTDISDIKWSGRFLWVVTDNGLARLDLSQGDGL